MISIGIQAPKAKGYALSQKNWPADPKIANKLNQHLSILKTTVMKKLIFPAVAALTLGLASCSSDEVNPGNGGGTVNYAEGGYVRLSINMPSTKGTRATSTSKNDQFEDGLAKEYAVKDAQLILFEEDASAAGEANAKFHSAYNIKANMEMEGDDDQITSMTKIVKKANDNASKGKHLYALVVLNNNGITSVDESHNTLEVNGRPFNTTFNDFLALTSETTTAIPAFSSDVETNGIFMTNAPLSSEQGGDVAPTDANIHTLTDVSNCIYKTEVEAQNAPAADIFVERAVAKVTFSKEDSGTSGTGELKGDEFKNNKVYWEIISWDLDVTNKKSYIVRNAITSDSWWSYASNGLTTGDKYRFIGKEPISSQKFADGATSQDPASKENFYRTYWAKDPNYTRDASTTDYVANANRGFYDLTGYASLTDKFGNANPRYCYENTFDVANMTQGQSTRAVVKVQLKLDDGSGTAAAAQDLYTFNNDRSKLYTKDNREKRVKAAILNNAKADIDANFVPNAPTTVKITAADINVDYENPSSNGTISVKSFVISKTYTDATGALQTYTYNSNPTRLTAVNSEVGTITEYQKGYAYYPIIIKHFGNNLTPWNSTEIAKPSPSVVYPTANAEQNYLGRYGVLRNNWYSISVNTISGVGSATVPEVPGKNTGTPDIPDDELYNYISVRINILSWAKRTQHEDL